MELETVLAGAQTDHDQLGALLQAIRSQIALPADARVVGEPVQVVAVEYDGHPRRGIIVTCRRAEERHQVGLADVRFVPGTGGARVSALYREWLGLGPLAIEGPVDAQARRHKVETSELEPGTPVDLVVLACKSNALRCRMAGTARELTMRTAVRDEVPGEIITVLPTKTWTHARHPYLSGRIERWRLDVAALGLVPLALRPEGDWDIAEAYWSREGRPLPEWARSMPTRGPRSAFVMERVIPGSDPVGVDLDPITVAVDLKDADAGGEAEALLMSLLGKDLRCLDAHAHLGNWEFTFRPQKALRHYAVGVGIGDLALGTAFDVVLPWELRGNRPYLRCLNGAGLASWCLGDLEQAAALFLRQLWLDPGDHQNARHSLARVEEGRSWKECVEAGR